MKILNKVFWASFLVCVSVVLFSCNKNEAPKLKQPLAGRGMKFVISADGITAKDTFSIKVTGTTVDGKLTDIFKKNGVLIKGSIVEVTKEDVLAGEVIVESTVPLFETNMTSSCQVIDSKPRAYQLKIVPEIDGVSTVDVQSLTVERVFIKKTYTFN